MNYGKNDGPQQTTIPQQTFTTCSGCKYFSRQLVRSGRDSIYANTCEHPESKGSHSPFRGNLIENHFGIVETPEWCPVRQKSSTGIHDAGSGEETLSHIQIIEQHQPNREYDSYYHENDIEQMMNQYAAQQTAMFSRQLFRAKERIKELETELFSIQSKNSE